MKQLSNGNGRRAISIILLALLCAVGFAWKSCASGLLIADGGFGGRLDIEEQSVNVTINNGIAVTEVTQVFRNKENRQVEALYTFPVPKAASVSNFSMWINGKEMIGEVLEKKRAREIYNSYKKKRRDPGLLEQKDYKTFEMRIFPIGPKAQQKVKLTYYQELDVDHDWATYVYPLATETKNLVNSRVQGKFALNINIKSEVPITEVESPSHKKEFATAKHTEKYFQASLESKEGDLNKDVVLAYHLQRPQSGLDAIYSKTQGEDGYICLTMTAGKELENREKGMDFVFVLDVSGSMRNDGKMGISKDAIEAFIKELGDKDKFEVMTFNVSASTLFRELATANEDNLKKASEFLGGLSARGGTDLRPAVNAAYKYSNPDRQLNVVILSDGMTEQGTRRELLEIISARPSNARVFCIGVGNEVNRQLLGQMAKDAGGLASFISNGDDFKRQAKAFRRKLMRPAISNLKIEFSEKVYDVEPKTLPNLYHGMPVRMYGRYSGSGQVKALLSGDINGKTFKREAILELPSKDDENPEIERMWAWHKVQRLLNDADRNGDRSPVISEIVRLGEAYSIASEYTSFLVLENDNEYKRWKIKQINATRIKRDRASREKLRKELETLRLAAAANIGPKAQDAKKSQKTVNTNRISTSVPAPQVARRTTQSSTPRSRRNIDFSLPRMGGGGGAVDPISGLVIVGMGALGACGWIRKRKKNK